MSFTDNLKKSLGFEEGEYGSGYTFDEGYNGEPDPFFEGILIPYKFPETKAFMEIILIKPKSVDDMDYIFDQVVEENNPVIMDLSFMEKKGAAEFKQAGEKLKVLRQQYNAEAILLSKSDDKNLIIVTPARVKLIRKE
ncbi:hypothetical protein mru_0647 [Methanobrevibacter ruminantium M1]|uniref:Cell division protein SepF n=1 Tax=Methanobrevibacter ruminantium (strain ATCC 35063 / DSM 1093 / JCM 13430 / OCM 146 / M1) TaxID=634498 RepID=D3E1T7_METRM|nr:cell division protein SepF [Methanobrevibacter ruminantium]ADC46498.1 hypothetical protein mru_0647 [Methanobrevibacter ruminantium M1]